MITPETATELSRRVRNGEQSATEVLETTLSAIEKLEPSLHAFLTVEAELARRTASEVDAAIGRGEDPGPLAGVPVALKDNICTKGLPTTCGSRILDGYRPPHDATVTTRLRQAGAVLVGKTNLDEFAMGSSTENSAFGPTSNPWDLDRVPGGSSGGSAAAVSGGLVTIALGSDTGGSIRQPASLCGIVGLKPTYGRVSRFGLVAFGSSLDQIGPLTNTVADAALALSIIEGADPKDATCDTRPGDDYAAAIAARDPGRLTIGVPKDSLAEGVDPGVAAAVKASLEALEKSGAKLVEIDLPIRDIVIPTYYLVATGEASSNLARYDGVRYGERAEVEDDLQKMMCASRGRGFGAEVKRRILLGTYALSAGYADAYYRKASAARAWLAQHFAKAFESVDVIATPTSPTPAFRRGEKVQDPLQMYMCDVFSVPANLVGLPGISVPCGFDDGLPVGLQLVAPRFREATLLEAAACAEDVRAEPPPWPPHHRLGSSSEGRA
ncbi:MAG: Asp-tRNA(Asn)/Glu-tRNA(Gln) amidotransferase subunit GatA [Planctomycetota bacterium]